MRINFFNITLLALFICADISAQNRYDINFQADRTQVCKAFKQVFRSKPKEVSFSIKREGKKLYFRVNSKEWFKSLFRNKNDGIAIDLVNKSRYDCEKESIDKKQIRGNLLKPVYRRELLGNLQPTGDKFYKTYVGEVSQNTDYKSTEYNLLFLSNKNLCRYQIIYNLKAYPWDLLDMGMYLDSLTYSRKEIKPKSKEGSIIKNKTLKFIVPFEKNKAEYTQEDIKPIYDSLRLTNFNIKTINIKAYSSVEGSVERNIELQQQRANSIVKALQSFQKPNIETNVSSAENWVEFLNDLQNTKHADLASLSKKQIKAKLEGSLAQELEPILKDHRKAVLKLQLEKKDTYKNIPADELVSKFNTAIDQSELKKARRIQNSIFDKIKSNQISPDYLRKLQIPQQVKFAGLINKNSAFRYLNNERQAMIVFNQLKELEKLVPDDGEVKYNITALKIKLWRYRAIQLKSAKLKKQIKSLENYGIDDALINRMLVNLHIIKAEKSMRERDYKAKDASVNYINKTYKKFELSDYDYLSLAQFFSYYANTDLAVALLKDKSKSIEIDEDLLFYYLNLTLSNKRLIRDDDYRSVLLNAYNMNQKRFCKLFNSVENGGVSFQLLENKYLKNTYCENCEG